MIGAVWRPLAVFVCFCLSVPAAVVEEAAPTAQQSEKEKVRQRQREEREDYYRRWLDEDVVYLITPDEKSVFQKLTTDEEKENFVEQFWYRRDPDLTTSNNEFKEEHYRRIAYANERFTSGVPGWKTDRGRIYIIHGAPASIEKHHAGENYERPYHEGGGFTVVFPFEIWRYRYIEGVGSDVELEFVDPSGSGEFRLARDQWEKDAFLFTPMHGRTLAESIGMAERGDRSYFSPYTADTYPLTSHRAKDAPFARYETMVNVQRPKPIRYDDLKEIVEVNIAFDNLPFTVRKDYFQLNQESVLVPVTFEIENRNLTFQLEQGMQVARVAIYGLITSMSRRVILEFDDDLLVSYRPEHLDAALLGRSIYQRVVPLEKRVRCRLDLVVKDMNSGNIGVTREAIIPPPLEAQELGVSSVILSDFMRQVTDSFEVDDMFVLGDIKVRPSLSKEFTAGTPVGLYLQVYNTAFDQATLEPSLSVRFRVLKDGKQVKYWAEDNGESLQFWSEQRVVLIKNLHAESLEPDQYRVEVEITDRISGQTISVRESFRIKERAAPAASRSG